MGVCFDDEYGKLTRLGLLDGLPHCTALFSACGPLLFFFNFIYLFIYFLLYLHSSLHNLPLCTRTTISTVTALHSLLFYFFTCTVHCTAFLSACGPLLAQSPHCIIFWVLLYIYIYIYMRSHRDCTTIGQPLHCGGRDHQLLKLMGRRRARTVPSSRGEGELWSFSNGGHGGVESL